MAIQAVSLVVLWFLAFSAAQNTCGEVQCKLVPVERDVNLTFQKLASEKSVRMVYFNLEISNDSFHSFESKERFFAKRWVWVTTLTEPMLFLPEDYDIYSLGLLKYQVRHMNVHLEEQPTGCVARLNKSCQDNALGETLLGNVVKVSKVSSDNHLHQKDFVCTSYASNFSIRNKFSNPIDREWHYLCCSLQNFTEMNDLLIRCGIRVESGWFLASLNVIFYIFMMILGLYWPAIFLLLPDFLFSLQHEYENENEEEQHNEDNQEENINIELCVNPGLEADEENNQVLPSQPNQQQNDNEQRVESEDVVNFPVRDDQETSDREIPLDDASPITFCALLGDYAEELPRLKINFNLKLLFLCFVVFPIFLHLKIAVTLFHKFQFYQETCQKQQVGSIACFIVGFYNWRKEETFLIIMFLGGCAILFLLLLFIRPKDLFSDQSVSISHEILRRLNVQRERVYDLTFIILKQYMNDVLKSCLKKLTPSRTNLRLRKSRQRRAFRSLCVLISVFPVLLVVAASGIFYIIIFLITLGLIILCFSPVVTCFFFFRIKTETTAVNPAIPYSKKTRVILPVFGCICLTLLYTFFGCVFFASVTFIIHTFLLTIMGLVLNAEFVAPYAAFILVIARNMHLCYSNLQSRYKEVKGLISKHWREDTKDLPWINCSSNETIPKELFWFVCGNNEKKRKLSWSFYDNDSQDSQEHKFALPLRTEMCCMLREITLISLFLFLSLLFILSLKTTNDISLLVSTIFVFISGTIPSLILGFAKKRGTFSGWNKIRIEKKIRKAVKEYIAKMELRHSDELVLYSIEGSITDFEMNC